MHGFDNAFDGIAAPRRRTGRWVALVTMVTVASVGLAPPPSTLAQTTGTGATTATWEPTTAMGTARTGHTATLLGNGQVLVAGGSHAFGPLSRAEVYDPGRATWSYTNPMQQARTGHTATLLPGGTVLVVGGQHGTQVLDSVEVYDPGLNQWFARPPLLVPRSGHTATLLDDGSVLVAGGSVLGQPTSLTERYVNDEWALAASMGEARTGHTATDVGQGRVLVAGGRGPFGATAGAETYKRRANAWSPMSAMKSARAGHTATELGDGRVLVTGGENGTLVSSTEIFDPSLSSWESADPLSEPRRLHTATRLSDGRVMMAGGITARNVILASTEVYDPAARTWASSSKLGSARMGHTATVLPDGTVLAAGGRDATTILGSVELYRSKSIPPLTVTDFSPREGPVGGGTTVAITGTGFTEVGSVTFGGAPATGLTVVSDTSMTVVTPAHTAGTVTVEVSSPTAWSLAPGSFIYYDLPGTVTDLTATAVSSSQVDLAWTAPPDGSGTAPATRYVIKQSRSRITAATFDAAASLCGGECVFAQAAQHTLSVTGLAPNTNYYYALKAVSPGGTGAMSNVERARTANQR